MSTLELRDVSKVFADGSDAVRGVDLTIADGEFFVVVGPSGCGKSTLLRMIAGLETPTTGEILIDGTCVNDLPTNRRDIAMAFQAHALYPHMSVAENIAFALRIAGVHPRSIDPRVADVARLLDIEALLDRRPHRLSGGQQQRVALARSIIRSPRLFLMDEPMSNLDSKLRTESRAELMKLQRRSATTTVFVTHDQVEAMAMADRVAVMRDGRVVQCAPPMEIYDHPVDMFVARFMGSPSMSIVAATVAASDETGIELRWGSNTIRLPASSTSPARFHDGEVGVGVRPEAFHRDVDGPIVASVTFTETLGSAQLVHATFDSRSAIGPGAAVTDRTDGNTSISVLVDSGDEVGLWEPLRLGVDPGDVHLFDLSTGAAIAW